MTDRVVKLPQLFPWQKSAVTAWQPKRHLLAVCSRQIGKTVLAQVIVARAALAGQRILWTGPIFRQIADSWRALTQLLAPMVKRSVHEQSIELLGGGLIEFKSADVPQNLRGSNYHIVVMDEAAFLSEDCWKVITPMLAAKQGKVIAISTPNGFNWFQSLYESAKLDRDWCVVTQDCHTESLLTTEEIAKQELLLSPGEFRQEYLANFIQAKGSLFKAEWLSNIMVDNLPDIFQRRAMGVDIATGRSARTDWQACVFMGVSNSICYVDCYASRVSVEEFNARIKSVYEVYRPECIAWEGNGFQFLAADSFMKLFEVPPIVKLLDNRIAKETRIQRLAPLLAQGRLKILNNAGGKIMFSQLADFPNPQQHDDLLDATEMAHRILALTS